MSMDVVIPYWTKNNKKASSYAGFWMLLEGIG
jgi:hypothetical protein